MSKASSPKRSTYHVGNLAAQFIQGAREMLEQVGPTKLSLRAVSERVGVSSTAAYHHFSSRTELISFLATQGFDELAKAIRERKPGKSELEKVRNANAAYFNFAHANPALYQLMFGPELSGIEMIPELRIARSNAFEELTNIISALLEMDASTPEVQSAALASWAQLHGLASLVIHDVVPLSPEMTGDQFVDTAFKGLGLMFSGVAPRTE